jgi:cephalosporin hydroxylase
MGTKDYKKLNQYILEGFARLLDLGSTITVEDNNSGSIEEDIYMTIKNSWEEVGENIREAMNQYDQERKR